ncbi:MAG TPA: hypothetical protein VHS06_02490 [Chloroflexota bacterium]|nr:hypothetical protein [Chloroflexota bacterium]
MRRDVGDASVGEALAPPNPRTRRQTLWQRFLCLDQRRLLALLIFLALFGYNFARPTDIDFWWHLKTGELIATTGAIPAADPFSYTVPGQPWVAHEWLWELAIYQIYTWGGYALAAILSAVAVTLTYLILYRLLRRLGSNEFVAAALVLWAAMLAFPGVGVRPRELTQLLLAFFLSRLFLYREGHVRSLWSLPPLMVLWVNVHGQFILGLGLLGLFAIEEVANRLFAGGRSPRHMLVVCLATLAACVNPSGLAMLRYPIDYYLRGENPSFAMVTEFQSPDFHQPLYLAFAVSLLLLAVLPRSLNRRTVLEALLVAVFTLQALVSVRQIAAYTMVVAPLIALRLTDRFKIVRELPPSSVPRPLLALNWLIMLAVVAMGTAYASQPTMSERLQLGREPLIGSLPIAGARFIEDKGLPDPVFHEQTWGGYLIYQWYPQRRVFMDGRVDMYGAAVSREYMSVVSVRPDWNAILDKYGVRTILIQKDSPLSTLLLTDGEWERVFEGNVEAVFVREGDH